MPELVKIPLANAEYQVRFESPHLGFIANDRQKVVEAIVAALLPFNLRLANTEIVAAGTLADHKMIFRIPERGITFQFGAEEYRFTKERASWATLDDDVQVALAAEQALLGESNVTVGACLVVLEMHLQPLTKQREEILAPFLPEPFKSFMTQRKLMNHGNYIKWEEGEVLLDFSAVFPDGIFLRLTSQFAGQIALKEILTKARNNQTAVFGILDIEEAANE